MSNEQQSMKEMEEQLMKETAKIKPVSSLGANRNPLLDEREDTHGDYKTTAQVSQIMKATFEAYGASAFNDRQRESLDLIATKLARILSGDEMQAEHWLDIAGYAELAAESCKGAV